MSRLFLSVLNMSLTASYVILFVIFVRLLLKKAPKYISYALWGVVAFRLIIPFSFESMFSLFPQNTNIVPIPQDIVYQQSPQINSGIEAVDSYISKSLPAPAIGASVNPLQIYTELGAFIWILGILGLLIYSAASIIQLKRQLKNAQLVEQGVLQAENLITPFVFGLIKPKTYLPVGLSIDERSYILLHEQTHIQRKDHIIKALAFMLLTIHWFNPLVWIAFKLMSSDMELSCDERVLRKIHEDIKKPYANSLLSLAAGKSILIGGPLAFGEENIKGRIKNVLNYKKPSSWLVSITVVAVIAVSVCLLANPQTSPSLNKNTVGILLPYQDVLNEYMSAISSQDPDALISLYAPDFKAAFTPFTEQNKKDRIGILAIDLITIEEIMEIAPEQAVVIAPNIDNYDAEGYNDIRYYYIGFDMEVCVETDIFYNGVKYEVMKIGRADDVYSILGTDYVYNFDKAHELGCTFNSESERKARNVVEQRLKYGRIVNFENKEITEENVIE